MIRLYFFYLRINLKQFTYITTLDHLECSFGKFIFVEMWAEHSSGNIKVATDFVLCGYIGYLTNTVYFIF